MVIDDVTTSEPILEVGQFYELITSHLESAFGRRQPRWVRGEVSKVFEKGHLYVDLVDAGSRSSDTKRPVLNAHCWTSVWGPLKRRLADEGIVIKPGSVVSFFGYVDVYAPQGKIGFTVTAIDAQGLLGDLARRRAELIARLGAEGLLESNKRLVMSPVALRVGLVASPGTEGFNDFTGQLLNSGYGFDVTLVTTLVQGEQAPGQIVSAISRLDALGLDVIALVRGGGSKGDLACFDDEGVARAIAHAQTPVWTGIGHTGDESVADLVAHTRAITPTKLGEELVARVTAWDQRFVRVPAQRLVVGLEAVLDEASEFVGERRRTMIFAVRDRLRSEERHLGSLRERLALQARHLLEAATRTLATNRQLLAAYDPSRRLAQGWSIVTRADGSTVTSVADVTVGETVRVRVSDGSLETKITTKEGGE
ncbi:MAG: exodeoxyribonuclease VII large subunit [Acidobacteriota bacterium]|nr:exodeoxyribonuclease VII large subunit [Acidobacteriota bacterium]